MAIEIRKETQIDTAECQYKNVDNSVINLTKTAQYTISPRLTKGCKDKRSKALAATRRNKLPAYQNAGH